MSFSGIMIIVIREHAIEFIFNIPVEPHFRVS